MGRPREEDSGVGTPPSTSINSQHNQERVPKLARLGHGCSDLPWLSTNSGPQPALPFQTRRFLPHRTWSSAEDGARIRDLRGFSSCSESMGRTDSQAAAPGSGLQTQGGHSGILLALFRQGPHGPCVCQLRPPSQCPGLAQPWLSPRLGVPPNRIVALNTFLGLQEACVGPSSTGLLGLLGRVGQGL